MTTTEKKNTYKILKAAGDYTLINRGTSFQPYVVCWLFDRDTYTWAQGHYFSDYIAAEEYMKERAN